jgi:hypothetical protein
MSAVLYPPSRPQSIGEVLDAAFRIFRATLFKSLPYSVLATLAGQLQNIYLIVTGRPLHKFGGGDPLWWALYVLGALVGCSLVNAILIRQATIAAGSQPTGSVATLAPGSPVGSPPPSASSSQPAGSVALREGFRKAPAAIAMILLTAAPIALCFVPLAAVPPPYRTWTLLVLGVFATYIIVLLACSWPALVLGQKGFWGSLRYSAHLVRGNWWRTLMIFLVALMMIAVFVVAAGVLGGVLAQFATARDVAVTTAVSAVIVAGSAAIYGPFFISMALASYGDLQARKEGIDLERRIAGVAAG